MPPPIIFFRKMNISVRNLRDPYFAFLWLQQVVLNLLINAIKAVSELDEGPRELSVTSQKVNEVHGEAGKEVTEGNALTGRNQPLY